MAARAAGKDAATSGFPEDPLWFKDAIVYQMHVRAFSDSSGDGIGDFRGLTDKLDYIHDLGVTAIWLLPFFPSPLRDDGYDTADYRHVNPLYGSLRDFKVFLKEAHRRGLRVITEMVMNHTSDQHEWFQKSRRAKPGDHWRDFYVWSDTADKYRDARVIFQDFEASNWSWDPVANAYFWHRFYHHQPDLNFENPAVRQAMLDSVGFWLEMGVDGLRLDAVPYLYEQEGSNCENLPATHEFLRELRRHVDTNFADKMLLAEANQWPEDAAAYFGAGDECHMNFHFPLMPRLFMAVEREDRLPIIDILEQTPAIPESCQWGVFLRNHDELTLEMVTDEERDYMYRAYATDPRARVNLGIRRRLAPLLKNDRRKIELMNALLLSLPGTPIIYYGDELGMGDNIYLGDRDGVRTPMQWNADRNAGFSRCNPQQLYLPPVIDAEYHYQALNVEVQQNSPHSLLWWMRRIIAARKRIKAFGRGTLEFLAPDNTKVLAYLRQLDGETVLVVANLSRFAQSAELDLARFRGQTPVELFGHTRLPPIGELPYFLTLGPHAFYWLRLEWPEVEAQALGRELPTIRVPSRYDSLFTGAALSRLQQILPEYLDRQRWFEDAPRTIQSVQVAHVFPIPSAKDVVIRLLFLQVAYTEGEPDVFQLPVIFAEGDRAANITGDHPRAGIARIERSDKSGTAVLCEAGWEQEFWLPLYDALAREKQIAGEQGDIEADHTPAFRRLTAAATPATADEAGSAVPRTPSITIHGGEQRNTSVVFDNRLILKLFRRLGPGENPELEIGAYLTRKKLACVPELVGSLTFHPDAANAGPAAARASMTVAVIHEFVPQTVNAWRHALDEVGRYFERIASAGPGKLADVPDVGRQALFHLAQQVPPDHAFEMIGGYLQSVEQLATRTAEMHLALAAGSEPAFAPQPFTRLSQRSLYQALRTEARVILGRLRKRVAKLPEEVQPHARRLAEREGEVLERYRGLLTRPLDERRIRCHGDFHLGQVLFTGKDFVIIDFEGQPNRPISERRIKRSPLRDVASMIRSLHYASHAVVRGQAPGAIVEHPPSEVRQWMQFWYAWTATAFLRTWLATTRAGGLLQLPDDDVRLLLDVFLLEKAIVELGHELHHRPDWAAIPLEGVLQLLGPDRTG